MKLSFIFELLLIFILIAFAASAVIDSRRANGNSRALNHRKPGKIGNKRQESSSANKYCSCSTKLCNCCREFNIPVVPLQGPGCASLQYLKGDRLAISMSFGERVLTNTTVSSKKPQPVCMPLPGGVSKFCGRVYNIARKGEDFNACLGLELRALKDVEAAVRVSCFRFGPNGLRVLPSQPLPVVEDVNDEDDDDDDDDDDDEDEDDFDFDDDDDEDDDEEDNDVDSVDYGTFSVFDEDFIGEYFQGASSSSSNSNKRKPASTTRAPVRRVVHKPIVQPSKPNIRRPAKPTKNKIKIRVTTPKAQKASTAKSTTTTTTTTTTTVPSTTVEISNEINNTTENQQLVVLEKLSMVSSPSPIFEALPVVAAMLQTPQVVTKVVPAPVRVTSATIDTPAPTATQTTQVLSSSSTQTTPVEQIKVETTSIAFTTTVATTSEATTVEVTTPEATTLETTTTSEQSDEDDESEEDPIADVVEEVIEDEIEETTDPTEANDKDLTTTESNDQDKQPKDVLDDIVDEMVGTISGDEESADDKSDSASDEEDDEDEEDDDDEEEDDDDIARNGRFKRPNRQFRGRQSRDMWLDRLHW